jgi:hypothetical protein
VPDAQAALQRLKDASAPPRSYGQRHELAVDKARNIYSVPLNI